MNPSIKNNPPRIETSGSKAAPKDLDIVIVNYNSTDYLHNCLSSVYSNLNGYEANVIVHDNASSDGPETIKEAFHDVELIRTHRNIGFSRAVNRALRTSNSPVILLLNPDTLIGEAFFQRILKFLEDHQNVGLIGPKVLEGDGTIQGSARSFPNPLTTLFGRKSPFTRLFPNNPVTRKNILTIDHDGLTTMCVDWVSGACMAIRRDAFESIDGLDERFFLYWEDTDLCARMKASGWQVCYYPSAQVTHFTGKSSDSNPFLAIFHFHRSCFYLFCKHARWPMKLLTPLAFGGLVLRCLVAMFFASFGGRLEAILGPSGKHNS